MNVKQRQDAQAKANDLLTKSHNIRAAIARAEADFQYLLVVEAATHPDEPYADEIEERQLGVLQRINNLLEQQEALQNDINEAISALLD